MTVPSVSRSGLPGPQSTRSSTGGWFGSFCHGDDGSAGRAAARANALPFRGGRGFSVGNDCASAKKGQAITAITASPSICERFNFFPIMLPPGEIKFRSYTKDPQRKTAGFYHMELTVRKVAGVCGARTESVADETRWDEKAGLRRDAVRSQVSTCSRH